MSNRMTMTNESKLPMYKDSRKGDIWRTANKGHFENVSWDVSPHIDYLRDYDESDTAVTEALSVSPATSKPSVDGFRGGTHKSYSSDEFDFASMKLSFQEQNLSSEICKAADELVLNEGSFRGARHGDSIQSPAKNGDHPSYHRLQPLNRPGIIARSPASHHFSQEDLILSPPRVNMTNDSRDNTSPLSSPTLSPSTLSPVQALDSRSPDINNKRPALRNTSQVLFQPTMSLASSVQPHQRSLPFQLPKTRQPAHPIPPPQASKSALGHTSTWGSRSPASALSPGLQSSVSQNRQHQLHVPSPTLTNTSSSGRSPQEVLKTLLRKKACLYEPGTSQAIALITWMVGSALALQQGYFTRQQLQSGVHLAVADKIDSGFITRTKVNRCMQCILNSCFHYIIPRPDGSEEKGDVFQAIFSQTVVHDTHLLRSLPSPWGDIKLDLNHLLESIKLEEGCCKEDIENEHSDHPDGSADANRRPVLLCFNDNVRSAEDVLRCHNEFIRDAAISANLVLTAEEWRLFFSKVDDDHSIAEGLSESSVSGLSPKSPVLKAEKKEEYHFSMDVSSFFEYQTSSSCPTNLPERWMRKPDYFGSMGLNDLSRFRSEWCCKRYDHNAALCRFAHASINQGWLRRDPTKFHYCAKICPNVFRIDNEAIFLSGCQVNACKDGVRCRYAHSQEEIHFHPDVYKTVPCEPFRRNVLSCEVRDICPHIHSCDHHSGRYSRRQMDWSPRLKSTSGGANAKHNSLSKTVNTPEATSTLYVSPAPESEFEKTLLFPGIKSLFRRHCSTMIAHHCGYNQRDCHYSLFGDNWGLPSKAFPMNASEAALPGFSLYSE